MCLLKNVEKQVVNRLRNGTKTHTSTTIDIHGIVKSATIVLEIQKKVLCKANFLYSPSGTFFEKKVSSEKQSKEKETKTLEQLINLSVSFLFGDTIMNDIHYKLEFKAENWMDNGYDDRVEENRQLKIGGCFAKMMREQMTIVKLHIVIESYHL